MFRRSFWQDFKSSLSLFAQIRFLHCSQARIQNQITTSRPCTTDSVEMSKSSSVPTLRLGNSTNQPVVTRPSPPPRPPAIEASPWLWRCHSCHIVYRLATTRRCLECDHEFCLGQQPSSNNCSSSGGVNKSRKRKRGGSCKSEFDYTSWAARGAWRRTILLNNTEKNEEEEEEDLEGGMLSHKRRWIAPSELTTTWGDEHNAKKKSQNRSYSSSTRRHYQERDEEESGEEKFQDKKDALFVRKRHDCWIHCDYPSECHHV